MKFLTPILIGIAAIFTAVAVTVIQPNPLNTLYVFAVPVVYLLLTPKLRLSGNTKMLLTGMLFIITLNVYSFGGYIDTKQETLNNTASVRHVSDVGTIGQLETMVNTSNIKLPIQVDMLTMLTDIDVDNEKRQYIMTLQLIDINVTTTDTAELNKLLKAGLNSQCNNTNFAHLDTIGIDVFYRYVDMNSDFIGKHKVDFTECKKNNSEAI